MKLFGSSRSSKHTSGHSPANHGHAQGRDTARSGSRPAKRKKSGARTAITVIAVILAILAVLALAAAIYVKTQVKPPEVTKKPNVPTRPSVPVSSTATDPFGSDGAGSPTDATDDPNAPENTHGRVEGVYTFLVVAKDKVGANTDGIMVAKFDSNKYTLDVVSIPRDTLVNVTTRNKKVNALYANGKEQGLMAGIADLMGYEPDFYCLMTLSAIEKVVDAIGGVKYNVPQNMDYDDPAQNLHIHFKKGTQTLNGKQAVEYMRFRKGYADQDLGRIEAQHSFLGTMASQILANRSQIPVSTLISIVLNDVSTSLDSGECAWFAKELLKMDSENVNFHTMPGEWYGSVKGSGYQVTKVSEWIELVNEYLNPFDKDLAERNFDILSVNSQSKLYATSGYIREDSWRSNPSIKSSGGSSGTTTKPTTPSTKPTTPSTKPTTPATEPTDSTKPSGATGPTDATRPADTTEPTGSTEPTDATDPAGPSVSTEPTDDTSPTEPEPTATEPPEETEPQNTEPRDTEPELGDEEMGDENEVMPQG